MRNRPLIPAWLHICKIYKLPQKFTHSALHSYGLQNSKVKKYDKLAVISAQFNSHIYLSCTRLPRASCAYEFILKVLSLTLTARVNHFVTQQNELEVWCACVCIFFASVSMQFFNLFLFFSSLRIIALLAVTEVWHVCWISRVNIISIDASFLWSPRNMLEIGNQVIGFNSTSWRFLNFVSCQKWGGTRIWCGNEWIAADLWFLHFRDKKKH